MTDITALGLLTAFIAGTASFLSPCVLPLVPGYLSYIAGGAVDRTPTASPATVRWRALGLSGCFVLGFSVVFLAFGASATAIGRLFLAYRYEMNIVAGMIIVLAGFLVMGLVRSPAWLQRYYRFEPRAAGGHPLAAGMLGMAFGFGWTPCIGPVLGGILMLSATTESVARGMLLLGIYALGLGLPFLIAAAFTAQFTHRLAALRRLGRYLQIGAGVVLVVMGIAVMSGQLTLFAIWLLKTFPVLGRIG